LPFPHESIKRPPLEVDGTVETGIKTYAVECDVLYITLRKKKWYAHIGSGSEGFQGPRELP